MKSSAIVGKLALLRAFKNYCESCQIQFDLGQLATLCFTSQIHLVSASALRRLTVVVFQQPTEPNTAVNITACRRRSTSMHALLGDPRLYPLLDVVASHSTTQVVGAPVRMGRFLHIGAFTRSPNRTTKHYTEHHLGAFALSRLQTVVLTLIWQACSPSPPISTVKAVPVGILRPNPIPRKPMSFACRWGVHCSGLAVRMPPTCSRFARIAAMSVANVGLQQFFLLDSGSNSSVVHNFAAETSIEPDGLGRFQASHSSRAGDKRADLQTELLQHGNEQIGQRVVVLPVEG